MKPLLRAVLIPVLMVSLVQPSLGLYGKVKQKKKKPAVTHQKSPAPAAKAVPTKGRKFFPTSDKYQPADKYYQELKLRVDSLQDALDAIRVHLKEYDKLSLPQIRKEIKHMLNLPDKVSRIILKNGTIVEGKIRSETLDELTVQTPIGILRIQKESIKKVIPWQDLHAKVVLNGDFQDQYFLDKRVFRGKLKNTGQRRADFVRIIFKLHDKSTKVVAQDSAFVEGQETTFYSGVISTSSLEPGAEGDFVVTVHLPPGMKMNRISYVTYKVRYEEFE